MDFNQFCDILFPLINDRLTLMYEGIKNLDPEKARTYIEKRLDFQPPAKRTTHSSQEYRAMLTPKGVALYNELSTLRLEIARNKSCPPYIIFSNRVLYEMTVLQPYTMEELRTIHGVGPRNSEQYGLAFLAVVMGVTEGNRFEANALMPDQLESVPTGGYVADSSQDPPSGSSGLLATVMK